MKIVVFGLTVTSSWGNGHATTYRSLLKALAARGHVIHFIENDVEWYHNNRDMPQPSFCKLHLYEEWGASAHHLIAIANDADVVVVGSYFPDALVAIRTLLDAIRCPLLFYDIDTPITLGRLRESGSAGYINANLIREFAAYLSFTGGAALEELEQSFGARRAVPFFCSVDPDVYRPSMKRPEFECDLSYLGTYSADRQGKLMRLLNGAAACLPGSRFLVAGPQYPKDIEWPLNVRRIIHLSPAYHPSFYSSCRFTLNLTRADMVAAGYSPSVRLFEASACGATILSDAWMGLEDFLTPGEEILLPRDTAETVTILKDMSEEERLRIGMRARERILGEHAAAHRAAQFEQIVSDCEGTSAPAAADPVTSAHTSQASLPGALRS
jgi:spore maturation protein CgeB